MNRKPNKTRALLEGIFKFIAGPIKLGVFAVKVKVDPLSWSLPMYGINEPPTNWSTLLSVVNAISFSVLLLILHANYTSF